MAGVAMRGCARSTDTELTQTQEHFENEEKILNGKINYQKNGYQKTANINNETTKMGGNYAGLPPMDWMQYDTFPGSFEKCSLVTAALTHLGLYLLMLLGFVNQLLFRPKVATERNREGYAPLYNPFEQFFSRYVYRRVRHCFNRPICSAPGAELTLKERHTDDYNWSFRRNLCSKTGNCNKSSGGTTPIRHIGDTTIGNVSYRWHTCLPPAVCRLPTDLEVGYAPLYNPFEQFFSRYVYRRVRHCFNRPICSAPGAELTLKERHTDDYNWSFRFTGKERRCINLGSYNYLGFAEPTGPCADAAAEATRRYGLALASSRAELGSCPLHVELEEATARFLGVELKRFSGSAKLIKWLRTHGHMHAYAHAMSPPVCMQILSAMRALRTPAGLRRVRTLRDNTHYFRERLRALGVVTYGHADSPVVPMLVYTFSKMAAVVERLTARGLATVGVGFPATPLNKARIRFCLSAAHSRDQLERCLVAIEEVVDELGLRYSRLR
ncbi:Serine palmitoyltransferase 2 [Papilio machaon]|uniref:Serine palmitoyltransferase 2 n=1 Tax=Papilio machaon TaxID=76193 RepID=A0A0N1IH53_PAPMA|nr:Serine palmitoyltransferase 2 [Papilio machaon]